jgi:hypothetical protein|tara:strand:+ start:731 stop:1042 length:312 start_codon:yes stop_codon:yes gene_type:complete
MDNIKNKMGKVTLVTPPSMVKPNGVSFTIVNLDEEQKKTFSKELDERFPSNEITVYVWDKPADDDKWLEEANLNSDYVIQGTHDIIKQVKTIKVEHDRRKFDL